MLMETDFRFRRSVFSTGFFLDNGAATSGSTLFLHLLRLLNVIALRPHMTGHHITVLAAFLHKSAHAAFRTQRGGPLAVFEVGTAVQGL